jgi:hypothetical protein
MANMGFTTDREVGTSCFDMQMASLKDRIHHSGLRNIPHIADNHTCEKTGLTVMVKKFKDGTLSVVAEVESIN